MKTERPIIDPQYVQNALNTLLYSTSAASPNPLWALTLVDEFLVENQYPRSILEREAALHHILLMLISNEFAARRAAREMPPPNASATLSEAKDALAADMRQDAKLLVGWSILYHRYVCSNIELAPSDLSDSLNNDERTVRRYQTEAFRQLTEVLTDAEWAAQMRFRQQRLISRLPIAKPIPLLGRDQELERVWHSLQSEGTLHTFITGSVGIGKTVFVQEVVRQLIKSESTDQVLWLSQPNSLQRIYDEFQEIVLAGRRLVSLRDYLSRFCVTVILDGLDALEDADSLQALLEDLSVAYVFLIHDRYIPLPTPHLHLRLQPLSESATQALVSAVLEPDLTIDGAASEISSAIWGQVGGHPLAALLLARAEFSPYGLAEDTLLDSLYKEAFSKLSPDLKAAWWAFALLPEGEVMLSNIKALWPRWGRDDLLDELARRHLIERVTGQPPVAMLTTAARRYLQEQAITQPEAIEQIHKLLSDLDRQLEVAHPAAIAAVEYLLEHAWLELPTALCRRWMRVAWQTGIPTGHCARWRPLLEHAVKHTESIDFELEIAYGVCLRRLSEWSEAQQILNHTAVEAGKLGDFLQQAWSFLELGVLARYRGEYTRSATLLGQAERAASRFTDERLLRSTLLERAQIAIDQKDPRNALRLLKHLPETLRTLTLQAEAWTLDGNVSDARRIFEQALGWVGDTDPLNKGRLYTALGRTYEQEGNVEATHYYFKMALNQFQVISDPFALARAQSNLGAVVLSLNALDEAGQLLTSAEQTQSALGDRVALEVTRHNLRLLYRKRSAQG